MAFIYSFIDVTLLGDFIFGLTPAEIFKNFIVNNQAKSIAFLNNLEGLVLS